MTTPDTRRAPRRQVTELVPVTDLMAGYRVNQHLDLQLNANNIFDRRYYLSISESVDYGGDTYGAPRNMMVTAKYSF